ncbi:MULTISPECIES: tetratricopeptide repeat protein [unclassified Janthinobacterium]|uniref:tetratricopeptide repeat protein n=1 Tax=unclassified Janthinobacterium TaxID=2610881 RepID=UPI000C6FCF4C|nr:MULTISPECIES: tetratricopeptide repeat protein [unclassified Janthinobacterium]PKV44635.1 tetratricopeptide repeat protein [Janthinobacterium sp. 61]TDY35161.1 tetratricopeptide repeat protein [Janthinobacterium sp. 75]
MSLLMQALKKAERAKQNSLSDEELEKPSEAYDQVLELAPADAVQPLAMPAAPPVQAASTLSLEPMPDAPAPPPEPSAAQPGSPPDPQPGAQQSPRPEAPPARPRASRSNTPPKGPTGPISVDPATMRLAVLLAILLLVAGSMAYWYWRASTNPGAGANLPGVPMPLTDAPGTAGVAGPIVVVPGAGTPGAATAPAPQQQALPPELQQAPRQQADAAEQQAMIQAAAEAAVAAQLARMPPPAPPSLPPVAAPDNSQIQVQRSVAAPQINPGVQQAYQAFNGGQLGLARQQYETVLRQDANNRDALLGLAALALRENQGAQAASLYVRLLEINPDDGEALAGLIGLRQGDVVQSEAKLKAILARTPDSAPVLFALGNVYAKQRRWNEAQQQFFRAYGAAPGNPDYAFNLAVGLDRLNQPRLAATYYQRALTLAQATPAAFDRAVVQARLRDLAAPAPAAAVTVPAPAESATITPRQE